MGWRSGFRRKLFRNLQSYVYTVSGKNVARDCTGDIRVMGLFIGVSRRGSVKPVNCIHTQFSHMPFTVSGVCRKISKIQNNYAGTWKYRQNMTGMETLQARGKRIANALVCQLC